MRLFYVIEKNLYVKLKHVILSYIAYIYAVAFMLMFISLFVIP